MTPDQARGFLSRTEWLEMVELALKQPMPDYIREKREQAKKILAQHEQKGDPDGNRSNVTKSC